MGALLALMHGINNKSLCTSLFIMMVYRCMSTTLTIRLNVIGGLMNSADSLCGCLLFCGGSGMF